MESPGEGRLGFPTGFAVVDVETTGLSPEDERIVEVGVVILDPAGLELHSFCTLVDPGRHPGPTHVHGISGEMLEGAPTFAAIRPFLAHQLSGRVVVGHNVDGFDLAFLRAECRRAGGEGVVPGEVPTLDTWQLAQRHLGPACRAGLAECCGHFGLRWDDHHHALGDARVTAALLASLRAQLGDDHLQISSVLDRARDSVWPGGSEVRPRVRVRGDAPGPRRWVDRWRRRLSRRVRR